MIDRVVAEYGPCMFPWPGGGETPPRRPLPTISLSDLCVCKATKLGAIVGGQTSCKAPELAAFDKHLPPDVEVVSCHSLHGPNVNPNGQPLV